MSQQIILPKGVDKPLPLLLESEHRMIVEEMKMLNMIQSALMDEAKVLGTQASDLHARVRSLAYAFQGMPEGVAWEEVANGMPVLEEAITEAAYTASTIHGILDARACIREVLRLRGILDSMEERLVQGEEELRREETALLHALSPAH